MIKNGHRVRCLALGAGLALSACQPANGQTEEGLQGVVELDERVLGFEVGGRVESVKVERGDAVGNGDVMATLDDTLELAAKDVQAAQAEAAESDVRLLKAGARSEDIRSMQAQIRAVKTSEDLLRKNLERDQQLQKRGVLSQSAVDEIDTKLNTTVAERQSLEQKLKALKRGARSQEISSATSRAEAADRGLTLESERVRKHVLQSVHEGVVLDVHVESGEVVAPGAPVVTVGDTHHPYTDVFVPIGKLDGIHVGTPGSVRVDSTSQRFEAKVEWISRTTEFTPRYLFSKRERPNLVVRVRLRVQDPEQKLHAGVPAFAEISRGAAK
jgi:membrane fusion protein YbhG